MKRMSLLLVLALSAGCGKVLLKPDMSVVADQPAAYQDGYYEGCMSGYVAGGYMLANFQRSTERAKTEEDYRLGWKKGYKDCKNEFRKMCREGGLLSEASLHCSDVKQQGLDKIEE